MKVFTDPVENKQNLNRQLALYEDGNFACQECKHEMALEEVHPLSMVECPECKSVNFVPLKLDRFLLFRPLGGGGMGSVYKGYDPEGERNSFVAVKVLSREGKNCPTTIRALLNEGRIANIIGDHPCLTKCLASGYENGEYYCALEYVEGQRLDQMIELRGKIDEKIVMQIALHLLAAEQHVYNCGYLYRDMKPENIIINNDGYAVLVDYGLCQTRKLALNPREEFVSGSPYYLPPERLLGEGEDACSEIYSLGMVMYYAITGETFFNASEAEKLAKRHVSNLQLPLATKMKGLDPNLIKILSAMVNQDPKKRFQGFAQVANQIRRYIESISS